MFLLGLDESGHGSIAGPMTVGLVGVDQNFEQQRLWDLGVCDSKLTTEDLRASLVNEISNIAKVYSIIIPVSEINKLKHNHAFDKHIVSLISSMDPADTEMYIDGLRTIEGLEPKATYIANGDQSNALIAAASIVAKNAHDKEMGNIIKLYPEWGFEEHRGYPIPDHVAAILKYKPIPGVHKLNPTYTAIQNYCKKNGIGVPKWAQSKDRLKRILCI